MFGHYERVDRALFWVLFRALLRTPFGLYPGSTRPTKVSASPVPDGRRTSLFFHRNAFGHYEEVDRALFRAHSGSTEVLAGVKDSCAYPRTMKGHAFCWDGSK